MLIIWQGLYRSHVGSSFINPLRHWAYGSFSHKATVVYLMRNMEVWGLGLVKQFSDVFKTQVLSTFLFLHLQGELLSSVCHLMVTE